ncbi:hypothetical protein KZP23_03075 [Echinicola marina]|uniref:BT_3987 domain-containing protein n=1 Tax=Echinicola marina TaxID=2859768 RepID=UPI001CF6943B|nr:DUF1735 domain-containing protein [Echinicola marina]UCS94031.1 hypothetical protein KZP23_03075 [Echinicola marina]
MKKILIIMLALLSSCGFEDYDIQYGVTSVYFYNQEYNRNIVVGEGLNLKVGSMLTGVLENDTDRLVEFVINGELVTGSNKTLLPGSLYTLDNASSFTIPKGEFIGFLGVKLDSAEFVNDPKAVTGEYVLPVQITNCNEVDSVNAVKNTILVSVSYWAKQHGNYYYSGRTIRKEAGSTVDTLTYKNNTTNAESIRQLITVNANTLELRADETGVSNDPGKGAFSLNITVPTYGGGKAEISPSPNSAITVEADGESSYIEDSKTFYLNYKWNDGTYDCYSTDTLVFRNRVRDVQADGQGVNEWRGF